MTSRLIRINKNTTTQGSISARSIENRVRPSIEARSSYYNDISAEFLSDNSERNSWNSNEDRENKREEDKLRECEENEQYYFTNKREKILKSMVLDSYKRFSSPQSRLPLLARNNSQKNSQVPQGGRLSSNTSKNSNSKHHEDVRTPRGFNTETNKVHNTNSSGKSVAKRLKGMSIVMSKHTGSRFKTTHDEDGSSVDDIYSSYYTENSENMVQPFELTSTASQKSCYSFRSKY